MNRFKEFRQARGLSQKEVGDYLGTTGQAYSNYENGKREPSFEILLKLGELFGTSVGELLGAPSPAPAEPARASDEDIKFALFGGGPVTDEQFEEVKRFAEFIKSRGSK